MNGRNRHNKYRRRVYKRHDLSVAAIISVTSVAVLIIALLIVGNLLHAQSKKRNNTDSDTPNSETQQLLPERQPTKSVNGYPVLLETKDSSTLPDRLDALVAKGIYDVSIPLNTPDGRILYSSEIANKIDVTTGTESVTLETASTYAAERNMYLSGVYYVNAFSIENEMLRSVELSKAAAVIAEALDSGINDVLIVAPQMTQENADEAIRFINGIKNLTAKGSVGLTVPNCIFDLENSLERSDVISYLYENTDFLAMDISKSNAADVNLYVGDRINSAKLYLHMYKIRVLLPNISDTTALNATITEAEDNGIQNWQILMY